MPTYLLQYAMINYSILNNCHTYNMGGVGIINSKGQDSFSEGLYTFKKKFGGYMQASECTYIIEL